MPIIIVIIIIVVVAVVNVSITRITFVIIIIIIVFATCRLLVSCLTVTLARTERIRSSSGVHIAVCPSSPVTRPPLCLAACLPADGLSQSLVPLCVSRPVCLQTACPSHSSPSVSRGLFACRRPVPVTCSPLCLAACLPADGLSQSLVSLCVSRPVCLQTACPSHSSPSVSRGLFACRRPVPVTRPPLCLTACLPADGLSQSLVSLCVSRPVCLQKACPSHSFPSVSRGLFACRRPVPVTRPPLCLTACLPADGLSSPSVSRGLFACRRPVPVTRPPSVSHGLFACRRPVPVTRLLLCLTACLPADGLSQSLVSFCVSRPVCLQTACPSHSSPSVSHGLFACRRPVPVTRPPLCLTACLPADGLSQSLWPVCLQTACPSHSSPSVSHGLFACRRPVPVTRPPLCLTACLPADGLSQSLVPLCVSRPVCLQTACPEAHCQLLLGEVTTNIQSYENTSP